MKRQMRLKKKAADLYPMQTREETFAKLSVRNIVSRQEVPSLLYFSLVGMWVEEEKQEHCVK